jgi:hypothetical protein
MFVHVKKRGGSMVYIAASEIARIDGHGTEVTARDGQVYEMLGDSALNQLLCVGQLIRGIDDAGAMIGVPVSSIDHVTDVYDAAANEWIATAVTRGGKAFYVDCWGRAVLGLDEEAADVEGLRASVARLKAGSADSPPQRLPGGFKIPAGHVAYVEPQADGTIVLGVTDGQNVWRQKLAEGRYSDPDAEAAVDAAERAVGGKLKRKAG